MTKRTEPKQKTDPIDLFVPRKIKIALGIEAAKLETTSSELVRAILNARIDTATQAIQIPAIDGDLVRMQIRIQRDSKKKIEYLSAKFDTSKHQIMRAVLINFLKEAGAI